MVHIERNSPIRESHPLAVSPVESLSTSRDIIAKMQTVPTGLAVLDSPTTAKLGMLTQRLIELDGVKAQEEYRRYQKTSERQLDLPDDRLRKHFEGKTILVTGGTGLNWINITW